ncbi:hypothetical protein MLP_44540 [Microlunatus phosphovorus NM-1]|uniref:Uncharacterized protein n=1 Tax=Microlunatus phosphovorus (strain ATCC 700054 / DSM 10555 / JCM 9379 / NBRC 101784 / NCIMB 13414 / VKM Ac-1990 / NM-1) TaxID=1032480 RepID=F5XTL9_MICPN|nr:hypothetical protein MLP_44540 [Microlunatus phosphovorus NM-1]
MDGVARSCRSRSIYCWSKTDKPEQVQGGSGSRIAPWVISNDQPGGETMPESGSG